MKKEEAKRKKERFSYRRKKPFHIRVIIHLRNRDLAWSRKLLESDKKTKGRVRENVFLLWRRSYQTQAPPQPIAQFTMHSFILTFIDSKKKDYHLSLLSYLLSFPGTRTLKKSQLLIMRFLNVLSLSCHQLVLLLLFGSHPLW